MEDTSGFYKKDGDGLLHGSNFVLNIAYELRSNKYDQYDYPVDGWYWFNSSDEAYTFFGLENPTDPQNNTA